MLVSVVMFVFFFFFQAEDGIRDLTVTGVQTCALPICWIRSATAARRAALQMLDAVRGGATLQGARDGALANLVERDRRLAYELAAGVLRRRGQLDRMLELATANPRLHDVLRLGAYQL